MALIGVSNGAIQFMAYEELKKRARERKVRKGMSEDEAMDLVRAAQSGPRRPALPRFPHIS